MSKLLCFIFLFPGWCYGQISFIQRHLAYDAVQRISPPLELPNGNFACSAIVSHNHIWVNVIYLFSECGELVTTLPISTSEEYMVISDLMIYDSLSFLATGYSSDSTVHSINLVLDNQTLEIHQDKRFFGYGIIDAGNSIQENGRIYQSGVTGYSIVSTVLNHSLNRNLHLYKDPEDLPEASFESVFFLKSLANRFYTLGRYKNLTTNRVYDVLRCQDQKLLTLFEIGGHFDLHYNTIKGTIGFLDHDTLLVAIEDRNLLGQVSHKYIRKYFQDSIIWQREVVEFTGFSTYSTCVFDSGILKCVSANGTVAWFNRQGGEIFFTDHLPAVLGGANMIGAILTHDGGWFTCSPTYTTIDGVSRSILKIIKTTGDYDISETPHPKCIVSTDEPEIEPFVLLFPNPARSEINIRSEKIIQGYKVYTAVSELLLSGSPKANEFLIEISLAPGYYSIVLEYDEGRCVQKFLIIN
ncbi:MAG TPA: T9SS type A sorting domain-containing protein [Saprospiraceae bacterium]|nr:T9SS type A sorting domain-containing protein [Saprospiraceae bacterium]